MAATKFARGGTHTNLVPQYWSKEAFKEMYAQNALKPYMGKTTSSVIQVKMDLTKKKGDKITFGIRGLLTGSGQGDDGTYEGNSEAMAFRNMDIQVHEHGHNVELNGNMSEQSSAFALRTEAKEALGDWGGHMQARALIDALSGLTLHKPGGNVLGTADGTTTGIALDAGGVQIPVVNQVAPTRSATAKRYFAGGQTTLGALSRIASVDNITGTGLAHLFGTKVIEYVKRMATKTVDSDGTLITPIRPIKVDGGSYYLMLVDRLQLKALRAESDWVSAVRELNARPRNHWLFNGASGMWDGVVIKECDLLHKRVGVGGTAATEYFDASDEAVTTACSAVRSLFLGAQAAVMGYAKLPSWTENYVDWPKTKWGFHTDMIYAVAKTAFIADASGSTVVADSAFGSIIVDTAVIDD